MKQIISIILLFLSVHSYAQEYLLTKEGKKVLGETGKFVKFDGTDFVMDSINSNDIDWPLLAPTSFTTQYSFEAYPGTGMFSPDGGIYLYTQNADSASNVIAIYAGLGTDVDGGPFEMSAGASTNANGGYFLITAGDSDNASGGNFTMNSGNAGGSGNGGAFTMNSGNGNGGGPFLMNAGNGTDKEGGEFVMTAGNSGNGNGGAVRLNSGASYFGNAGTVEITAGASVKGIGGGITIVAGDGKADGGKIVMGAGSNLETGIRQRIELYSWGVLIDPITEANRAAIVSLSPGLKIYCSDCVANDNSIGVEQTYNGTTWKNLW